MHATQNVLKFTKTYQNDSNPFEDFANKYIEKTNDANGIKWSDLKTSFVDWYRDNKDKNIPNPKEIKSYFEKNILNNLNRWLELTKNYHLEDGKDIYY